MRNLVEVCLLTDQVSQLSSFYQILLQMEPVDASEAHVSFCIQNTYLSIYAKREMEAWAPGSTHAAESGNSILGFEVENVDVEFERLTHLNVTILRAPTTFPWGRRAVWFQDPEGNIITFSAPVDVLEKP